MEIENANEESDTEEDGQKESNRGEDLLPAGPCSKRIIHDVEWIGNSLTVYAGRTYYNSAKVGKFAMSLHNCISHRR